VPLTLLHEIDAFRKALDAERSANRTVGLVPTMGYLHGGHTSLIARAAGECDVVAATLFVNPLQFGPTEDLATYPRDAEGDRAKAEASGADYLFVPTTEEMFPEPPLTTVAVGGITENLEGRYRPTHFAGVATIVAKLFAMAGPCRAYFGEKDYQQLVVVRRMARDLSLPVDVVGCPTVRTTDGLALSSRNAYLTPEERAVAPTLYYSLLAGKRAIEDDGERDPRAVTYAMANRVGTEPRFTLDYAEAVDAGDLSQHNPLTGEVRLLIAARLGRTRLIDNLGVHV
jgi:pantoate--beta-alanine ligase